jgi:hypothetical protein
MQLLGLTTPLIRQKALHTTLQSTPMLVEILQASGGSTYLCGGGAEGYQEDHLFEAAGITLEYQGFKPSAYGNPDGYLPGLSVLDYLLKTHDVDYVQGFERLCTTSPAIATLA